MHFPSKYLISTLEHYYSFPRPCGMRFHSVLMFLSFSQFTLMRSITTFRLLCLTELMSKLSPNTAEGRAEVLLLVSKKLICQYFSINYENYEFKLALKDFLIILVAPKKKIMYETYSIFL